MNTGFPSDGPTTSGTVGGFLLVWLLQIQPGQLVETVILSAVGAAVSFSVSLALKWLFRRFRQKS